jgi:DNA-binding response OmpR family regulator
MFLEVLVIDDDAELNAIFGEYLRGAGFGYHQALTGEDGLLMARNTHPDVIVLDVMLPDKDGYEICRTLKSSRATSDIPIIFLTCMCEGIHSKKAYLAGAYGLISKPYSPDLAVAKVQEAAQWHQSLSSLPVAGKFHITQDNVARACRSLNEMLTELVTRTAIDDTSLQQLRNAFNLLFQYVEPVPGAVCNGRNNQQAFSVEYTIDPSGGLSQPNAGGGGIFCTILEDHPGIIDAVIHAPKAKKNNISVSPLQQLWGLFLQAGALTQSGQDDARAALRVQRRFRPGGMFSCSDGNVMPIVTTTNQNSGKPH